MDGNDSRRIDRLEAALRAAHARRQAPAQPEDAALAASVLAALKAAPSAAAPPAVSAEKRLDRLEDVLRAAHAGRETPPGDAGLAASVVAAVKAEDAVPEAEDARMLWRMAAGAGFLAAATVLFALTFGSGLEDELGRLLFYDPSGQVVVSLLGV